MSRSPQCTVRAAEQRDVPTLVQLLEAYMHETFKVAWRGSAEALRRDGFGQEFECQVAVTSDGRVIGFVAWTKSYDLHHCMTGGSILDLYVLPESRGRGVAPALVCAVAAEIRRRGGTYVKGQAVNFTSKPTRLCRKKSITAEVVLSRILGFSPLLYSQCSSTVSVVVRKSGEGCRDTLNPIYTSPTTNAMKRRMQSNSGKAGEVLCTLFPIHLIVTDIEAHGCWPIHHRQDGLSFFESHRFFRLLRFAQCVRLALISSKLVCPYK